MKKSINKLSLNKMTISNLNASSMNEKVGGISGKVCGDTYSLLNPKSNCNCDHKVSIIKSCPGGPTTC